MTDGGRDLELIEHGSVTLTDVARAQLSVLLGREKNPSLALRLYVTDGGCSGLQDGMAEGGQ